MRSLCRYLIEKREGEAGCVQDGEEDDGHEGRGDGSAEQEDQRENLKREKKPKLRHIL